MGDNRETGQPITTTEWIDRLAPRRHGRRRRLRHLRRHPGDEEQPDGRDGPVGPPRPQLEVQGRHPDREHPGLPGAAGQHHRDADVPVLRARRPRAGAELDDVGRPKWLFERTAHELQPRGLLRGGRVREGVRRPPCLVKLGCKGPVVKCNVPLRGWVNGMGGCPNVGGICMACTMPGFPDKYMPFMDARWAGSRRPRPASPTARSCAGAGVMNTSSASTTRSRSGATTAPSHHRLREALVEESVDERGNWSTSRDVVDPITRIVGSLGIEIDFDAEGPSSATRRR